MPTMPWVPCKCQSGHRMMGRYCWTSIIDSQATLTKLQCKCHSDFRARFGLFLIINESDGQGNQDDIQQIGHRLWLTASGGITKMQVHESRSSVPCIQDSLVRLCNSLRVGPTWSVLMLIRSLWFGLLSTFPLFEPYVPEYKSSKRKYSNHIILMSKMTFHFNSNYKSIAELDWILNLHQKTDVEHQ